MLLESTWENGIAASCGSLPWHYIGMRSQQQVVLLLGKESTLPIEQKIIRARTGLETLRR